MFQFDSMYEDTVPREPLRREMYEALEAALNPALAEQERRYWLGVAVGYSVAFGIGSPDEVREAEATWFAEPVSFEETRARSARAWPRNLGNQDAVVFASGVLMGFWQGTSERADAHACVACNKRICTDVDDHQSCPDGLFCPEGDCYGEFPHRECRAENVA